MRYLKARKGWQRAIFRQIKRMEARGESAALIRLAKQDMAALDKPLEPTPEEMKLIKADRARNKRVMAKKSLEEASTSKKATKSRKATEKGKSGDGFKVW